MRRDLWRGTLSIGKILIVLSLAYWILFYLGEAFPSLLAYIPRFLIEASSIFLIASVLGMIMYLVPAYLHLAEVARGRGQEIDSVTLHDLIDEIEKLRRENEELRKRIEELEARIS